MATQQRLFHHAAGESLTELQQEMEEMRGRLVAADEYPQWLDDRPDVISAYVPNQDDTVKAVSTEAVNSRSHSIPAGACWTTTSNSNTRGYVCSPLVRSEPHQVRS